MIPCDLSLSMHIFILFPCDQSPSTPPCISRLLILRSWYGGVHLHSCCTSMLTTSLDFSTRILSVRAETSYSGCSCCSMNLRVCHRVIVDPQPQLLVYMIVYRSRSSFSVAGVSASILYHNPPFSALSFAVRVSLSPSFSLSLPVSADSLT